MMRQHTCALVATLMVTLAACSPAASNGNDTPGSVAASTTPAAPALAGETITSFAVDAFAGLDEEPVSEELAGKLQDVLDRSARGDGLTAALISAQGTWTGATGLAAGRRAMVPEDQMSIAHIT